MLTNFFLYLFTFGTISSYIIYNQITYGKSNELVNISNNKRLLFFGLIVSSSLNFFVTSFQEIVYGHTSSGTRIAQSSGGKVIFAKIFNSFLDAVAFVLIESIIVVYLAYLLIVGKTNMYRSSKLIILAILKVIFAIIAIVHLIFETTIQPLLLLHNEIDYYIYTYIPSYGFWWYCINTLILICITIVLVFHPVSD